MGEGEGGTTWEIRIDLYPLEKEMAVHSSTLAWKIPWTGEPGRLQSVGSQRVGHDFACSLLYTRPCVKQTASGNLLCRQGVELGAL